MYYGLVKFNVFSLVQWPPDRSSAQVHTNELEQLERAEQQGYDGAWLAEHPLSRYGIGPSIHLTAAALASRTERIRIGTAVTMRPFFHPLRLAEEIAMLDIMSGGRFDWAVGCGDSTDDDEPSPLAFREQLDVMLRAWTGA